MLNLCKGHVFARLNYPHIIGVWGYERHHDVARMMARLRPKDVQQSCQIEPRKLQGKQWRTKGKTTNKAMNESAALKFLQARAVKTRVSKARIWKDLPPQPATRRRQ